MNQSPLRMEFSRGYFLDGSDPSVCHEPPFRPQTFDRILLDAPCSALGQRPSIRNDMSLRELHSYPRLQERLLSAAVRLLKPGGVMVYSTCTFIPEENEIQMEKLLNIHSNLKLESQVWSHKQQQ